MEWFEAGALRVEMQACSRPPAQAGANRRTATSVPHEDGQGVAADSPRIPAIP